MKTIDWLIDFFDRLATPRMTDTQIEVIENRLVNLAKMGDQEAAGKSLASTQPIDRTSPAETETLRQPSCDASFRATC